MVYTQTSMKKGFFSFSSGQNLCLCFRGCAKVCGAMSPVGEHSHDHDLAWQLVAPWESEGQLTRLCSEIERPVSEMPSFLSRSLASESALRSAGLLQRGHWVGRGTPGRGADPCPVLTQTTPTKVNSCVGQIKTF